MKIQFGLSYFFFLIQIHCKKYNFLQIDIKLDLHVCYVLLINIVKNKLFSITDTRGTIDILTIGHLVIYIYFI